MRIVRPNYSKSPSFIYASMSGEIDNGPDYWGDEWKSGWERVSTVLKDKSHINVMQRRGNEQANHRQDYADVLHRCHGLPRALGKGLGGWPLMRPWAIPLPQNSVTGRLGMVLNSGSADYKAGSEGGSMFSGQ